MKTISQPKRLQFSKLPLSTGRVLQQRKTFQNQLYVPSSTSTPSAKKITFTARVTNLSSSSMSLLSSNSSYTQPSNLNVSRTSFDTQRIISNDNRQSFSQLKMYERIQPFKNNENQVEPPPLGLIRRTQSNYEEGYDHLNSSRLLEKYRVKPVFEESAVEDRSNETPENGVEERVKQLQREVGLKDEEIANLKKEIERNRQEYQQSLQQNKNNQNRLEKTIQQLNLIIFQLRNTKQYQAQIILMLEEKERAANSDRQSMLAEIDIMKQDKFQLWEHNRNLKILLESLENREDQSEMIDDEINSLTNKIKIDELEKTLTHQNNILKGLKNDVKKREERISQLEEFIDQSNTEVIRDYLFNLNNSIMRQEPSEHDETQQQPETYFQHSL